MSNHANQSLTNEANQALNFSDVYLSHLPKIKACIRKLDYQSGFKRSTDQINELAQDFFTKVWVDDILSYFDSSKAKSKDAILAYLYNHLRNFYRLFRTKEIRYAETNRKLTINRDFDYISNNQVTKLNPDLRFKLEKISGVLPEEKEKAHKEISKLDVGAVSNFSKTITALPSDGTKPSLFLSKGLLAIFGLSFCEVSACMLQKPPNVVSQKGASAPPANIISASPLKITS